MVRGAVDLVYDDGCANVIDARTQLLRAFAEAGLPARWREWRADDPDAPARVRGFGSPAILVDGRDVSGAEPVADLRSCRLYGRAGKPRGGPPAEEIVAALLQGVGPAGGDPAGRGGRKGALATVSAVGVALLPKVACPACWPDSWCGGTRSRFHCPRWTAPVSTAHEDIAAATGLSLSATRSRLPRARLALRTRLARHAGGER